MHSCVQGKRWDPPSSQLCSCLLFIASREGRQGRRGERSACLCPGQGARDISEWGVICCAFLLTAGRLLLTQHSCKCSLSSGDLGAESAAQLSVLLDYQLIRAVKSPLLNNQHGAFWLLCSSGMGEGGRAASVREPLELPTLPSRELWYPPSSAPCCASFVLMGCGIAGIPPLSLA